MKKKRTEACFKSLICGFLVILSLSACSEEQMVIKHSEIESERISIITLIATPEKYHDIHAKVRGYLWVDEEGAALYVAKEDAEYEAHLSAIWIGRFGEINTFTEEELRALHGQYVEVTGTIDTESHGPGETYNCEIKEIENIKALEIVNELPADE